MGSSTVLSPAIGGAVAAVLCVSLPLALSAQGGGAGSGSVDVAPPPVGIRVGEPARPPDPSAPIPIRRPDAAPVAPILPEAWGWWAPFPLHEGVPPPATGGEPVEGAVARASGAVTPGADVVLDLAGAPPAAGTRLQLWRPDPSSRPSVGWPVAVVTLRDPARARVDALHDRIRPGDRVRLLPQAPELAGASLEPVPSGRRFVVVALLPTRALVQPGDWVLLEGGRDAGLHPGAEVVPVHGEAESRGETRLRVVAAHSMQSIARVIVPGAAPPTAGTVVRLDRRVRPLHPSIP